MFAVDTNVLVHAVNRASPLHERARTLVRGWVAGPESWYVTWPIVYEFLRVATHAKVFPSPVSLGEAHGFVGALLGSPRVSVLVETERHGAVLADLVTEHTELRGSILHDLHTVALMREHGVMEIRTLDRGFGRFKNLRVVDPFTS